MTSTEVAGPTALGRQRWARVLPIAFVTYSLAYLDRSNYSIGVAAGIGAEDPTAGLGALGAFGDAGSYSNQGGTLTVFALDNAARK